MREFGSRHPGIGRLAVLLLLMAVVGQSPTAAAGDPPPDLTVMVTGDSVAARVVEVLDARASRLLGWNVVSATTTGCPVSGESPAWPNGTLKGSGHCPSETAATQDATIQDVDPDIVIWWDRFSISHFLTADGEFVRSNSARFWEIRNSTLEQTVARLTVGGARVVFIATEPQGIGVYDRCPRWRYNRNCWRWLRFQVRHYFDITREWNRTMKGFAIARPDLAAFISITDDICRSIESPCDDRISGVPARHDGSHYKDRGRQRAATWILADMVDALYPDG